MIWRKIGKYQSMKEKIFQCPFYETSVKEDINITELYQQIIIEVRDYLEEMNSIIIVKLVYRPPNIL